LTSLGGIFLEVLVDNIPGTCVASRPVLWGLIHSWYGEKNVPRNVTLLVGENYSTQCNYSTGREIIAKIF